MNQQRYRVVFNRFRSALMVVSEASRAVGKEAGRGGDVGAASGKRSLVAGVRPLVFSLWAALGWVISTGASAQVVADPSAPGTERPTVLNAPNGVPLVNIQSPSAAGVSRNVYSQFDVQQQGAILNNSRSATATQLGGWVQGNPWLAKGSARVILNEINSSNPSQLRGYVEVAGQRAQVIIANPAGISCDGCGFINANRATLTTGQPIMNGGQLEGYRVQRGHIEVKGAGLDARGADYADLIARAVQINAGIWAKELNVMTGSQTVVHTDEAAPRVGDALSATDAVPSFAIDVAQLGGMYAGKILLVGTEAGVGVRNAGQIGAAVGEVIVTAEGRIENSGRISAQGDAQLTSQADIDNNGSLYAQGHAHLSAGQTLRNRGALAAAGDTTVSAGQAIESAAAAVLAAGLQADGHLGASGTLRLEAIGHIAAHGQNLSGADQSHQATELNLSGSQTRGQNIALSAERIDLSEASVLAQGQLTASAQGAVHTDRAAVLAGALRLNADSLSNTEGLIALSGADRSELKLSAIDNRGGQLVASAGAWAIEAASLDNQGGQLQAASELAIALTSELNNAGGLIRAGASAYIDAARINNSNTAGADQGIEADALSLSAESINNQSGSLRADEQLNIAASATVDNRAGLISSAGTLSIADRTPSLKRLAVHNLAGTVLAGSALSLDAATSSGGGSLLSLGDLSLKLSQDYAQADEIKALADAHLHIDGGMLNQTDIQAGGLLALSARQLLNDTTGIISAGELRIDIEDTLSNQGLLDGGRALIRAHTLANYATGRIYGDDLAIGVNNLRNESTTRALLSASQGQAGQPAESGMIRNTLFSMFRADWVEPLPANPAAPVGGGKVQALKGPGAAQVYREVGEAPIIVARHKLELGAQTIINDIDARLFSGGDLAIGGALDADAQLTGQAAQVDNRSGTIEALGAVDINTAALSNTNEVFITQLEEKSVEPMRQWQLVDGGVFRPHNITSRFVEGEVYTFDCEAICLYAKPVNEASDQFNRYDFTRRTQETAVVQSKPGQILSGSGMRIRGGSALNKNSWILAGGAFDASNVEVNNQGEDFVRVTTDQGTVSAYRRQFVSGTDHSAVTTAAYAPPSTTTALDPSDIPAIGKARYLDKTQADPTGNERLLDPSLLTEVKQKAQGAGQVSARIRAIDIQPELPASSLFNTTPTPTARYLIETDPRFADYRQWLSSDYLLDALALDPATIERRLGDGFYEQELIRDQIIALTGHRRLAGYADDEAQFAALMQNAVAFAQDYTLRPGIALSAEQMAELTTDIVWLVEKTVTMADGQQTRALVPQVYVRAVDGDLSPTGALISGERIVLDGGQLTNSGSLSARQWVSIDTASVNNLGRISGRQVAVQTAGDLASHGRIDAVDSLLLAAGRDLSIASTVRADESQQNIDRIARVHIQGANATVLMSAARNLTLTAANLRSDSQGNTVIVAGGDIHLDTLQESRTESIQWDQNNWQRQSWQSDIGSQIQTTGKLLLQAAGNMRLKAAALTSERGGLDLISAGHIDVSAGQSQTALQSSQYSESRGFLSRTSRRSHTLIDQSRAVASELPAEQINLHAGQDITIGASQIVATGDLNIAAAGNIHVSAQTDQQTDHRQSLSIKSGLMRSGMGLTLGKREQSLNQKGQTATATGSTLGSIEGNVHIQAGKAYRQEGSELLTPAGSIEVSAQNIQIQEAREASRNSTEIHFKQSGVSVALSGAAISAMQTADQMRTASKNTGSSRMKLLAAAGTALAAGNAADAMQKGQGQSIDGKENQIITGQDKQGNVTTRDANAADKAGGLNVHISLGVSSSESQVTQSANQAAASSLTAGQDIRLTATGAGQDSNITVQGARLKAAGDIALAAQNQINLLAAQEHASQTSRNRSASGSVGLSFGTDGLLFNVSASAARGSADGQDQTHRNTQLEAGNRLMLTSGGDTTVKGAVAQAHHIRADVGGDLHIESLQDSSVFDSKQHSAGASVAFGAGKGSGSVNLAASKVKSNYLSVIEQSGLFAGDGGFDVKVKGNSTLIGGAITSTEAAVREGKNRFNTDGQLTLTDLENRADYSASGGSLSASTSRAPAGGSVMPSGGGLKPKSSLVPSGSSAGFGRDSGHAASTTRAAISGIAGDKAARTGDAPTGIARIFDPDKVQRDIDAQTQITQTFGREASKAIGDYAAKQQKQADELRTQARHEPDPSASQDLLDEAQRIDSLWGDQGSARVLAHTAVGALTGGASGAAGAAAGTLAAPEVAQALAQAGVDPALAKTLTAVASTAVGAAVGGATGGGQGAAAGGGAALNEVANNFLMHAEALKREKARQRQLDCTDQACMQAAQREIDELNALDAWRDAQIEVACRTAASASCQSWSMAIQAAKLSFEGYDGREDTTGSIRLERAQVNEAAFMYGQRTNNPAAYGVAKGLLKLVPPVALASAGIGAYELTGAIFEHGMADTAIVIAQGIKELPADIKARLRSDDPAVRGEALVEALAIGGSAAYVSAKLAHKAGQSFAQTLAKQRAAQAEAQAIAKARVDNNFYTEGGLADPSRATSPLGQWKAAAELGGQEANALLKSRLPRDIEVKGVEPVEGLNAQVIKDNPHFKPPYLPNSQAVTFSSKAPTQWVRVYAESSRSGQIDSWMMRAADVRGLNAEQIASKYALPQVPTHITDVRVPAGIQMRATVANDIKIFENTSVAGNGGGGGVQFEVLTRPATKEEFATWFMNPRKLK